MLLGKIHMYFKWKYGLYCRLFIYRSICDHTSNFSNMHHWRVLYVMMLQGISNETILSIEVNFNRYPVLMK